MPGACGSVLLSQLCLTCSGLALANNTLLLPHRGGSQEEEEEEGMTWVPVQARVTAFFLNRIERKVVHLLSFFGAKSSIFK